jgi:hypothetical protein
MSRLPTPGGDDNQWGAILNDFLAVEMNTDGTLKIRTDGTLSGSGGVPTSRQIIAGTGLNGGGDLSADRTLAVTSDTTTQKVEVATAGTLQATRKRINFISGTNATVVAVDDNANNKVDVTISSSGGSGASVGSATPLALGTAAAGAAATASREDHVHPTTGLTLATGGGQEGIVTVNGASGATPLSLATGNVFNVTLTGDVTFSFTGATAGKACSFGLYISQDVTGGHLVTWPAGVKWSGGPPSLSTASSAVDILVFETINNGGTWFASLVGTNFQ